MRPRLFQWIALFFTRPIQFSDLSALAKRLKPLPKRAAESGEAIAAMPDASPRSVPPSSVERKRSGGGERKPVPADTRPAGVASSMFRPELEIGVSEQPLDSLPAALQDELVRPKSGRLEGSSPPPSTAA